nr:acyl-CoA carboxylase subunit epsilon [Ornithinimicrobium sp. F0845]
MRVVSGNPTAVEIAVLTAVVAAVSGGGDEPSPPAPTSLWSRTSRVPGHRLPPGPGAWRASGLPH